MPEKSPSTEKACPLPEDSNAEVDESTIIHDGSSHLQRKLDGKQVQLFAIGAAIGTGVFVSMGSYLPTGGPAGLFLGFLAWAIVAYGVNDCYGMSVNTLVSFPNLTLIAGEMVCYAPVPAPFIRFASDWVDDALGFAVSWSFFFNQALLIPFEITAFQRLIGFWTDKMPLEATVFILLILYG